ncbi:hypothetical protein [Bacillus mycoides]|uniref:hypothetical protein n=1 Tax=Bacillus mycoides TaxID=1405 RepID=UPI001F1846D9|nr:hypothetical protein [Bacillus mycoides]
MNMPWNKRGYALYKGEQFLSEGTILEISKKTNKSLNGLRYMLTAVYLERCGDSMKRLRLISLDDDEDSKEE